MSLLAITIVTTPPTLTTDLTSTLQPVYDRFMQLASDGWDVLSPWLTLLVAVRLVLWWLSWRSGRKTPTGTDAEW
jgi:hypothetical protein